jgi:hypothetical protein
MFVVISKWEIDAVHDEAVRESARKMMADIRSWDGVESAFNVKAGDNYVLAVISYTDQAAYDKLISDPEGPFEKAAAKHGMEDHARWVWSERGDVVEP